MNTSIACFMFVLDVTVVLTNLWHNKPSILKNPNFVINRFKYPTDQYENSLFYESSFAFVDFIESKMDKDCFIHPLVKIGGGKSIEEIIKGETGETIEALYNEWVLLETGLK